MRVLTILRAGLATGPVGLLLGFSLRERRGLALALALRLFQRLRERRHLSFQSLDHALQLGAMGPKRDQLRLGVAQFLLQPLILCSQLVVGRRWHPTTGDGTGVRPRDPANSPDPILDPVVAKEMDARKQTHG